MPKKYITSDDVNMAELFETELKALQHPASKDFEVVRISYIDVYV